MTWQGIPYPLSNILESSYLTVSKIPTVVVDTGFAWENVIGAFIAGVIPAYIAWYTIKKNIKALEVDRQRQQDSFDKDRAAQLDIATKNLNAQVLSNNRQQWINNLRDLMAEYMALAAELLPIQHDFIVNKEYFDSISELQRENYAKGRIVSPSIEEKFNDARSLLSSSIKRLGSNRVKERLLVSKIKMMMNPNEQWYNDLTIMFADVVICYNSLEDRKDYPAKLEEMNGISERILKISQKILKYEWERVKLMV